MTSTQPTQIGRSPHFFALRDAGVGFRTSTQPTQIGEKAIVKLTYYSNWEKRRS
ncbi:hypothetical protein [Limnospira maxima]|uniref:hypothetical protein n=1 Tax=Limnospira TaxID=2596745 RepID=UPI0002DB0422|nr:hypothetical protein [Limnospira maxima]